MQAAGGAGAIGSGGNDLARVRKLLIVRDDRIGDVILTLPVASAIKTARPDIELHVLLRRRTAPLAARHPHVDRVVVLPDEFGSAAPGARSDTAVLEAIRHERYDMAIVVHSTATMARLMWRARIPLRQGNGLRLHSWRYNRRIYQRRRVPARHELDYNLDLVRRYVPVPSREAVAFHLAWSDGAARSASQFLAANGIERFMIIHPGSGGSAVDLPVETFAAWVNEYPYEGTFVLTGTAEEASLVDELVRGSAKPLVNAAGRLSLEEMMPLIARSEFFLANSTGPLHIARALERPLLGFYTTVAACHPKRWGPYGWERTHTLLPPGETFDRFAGDKEASRRNMARVTPAMITEAVDRIRRAHGGARPGPVSRE